MGNTQATRTQRRMARRQAMMLFVLVLVVALVSFSLGVMVGRSGRPPEPAYVETGQPLVLPEAKPQEETTGPAGQETGGAPKVEDLTFYDTLPKGELPLGSGINLPAPPKPAAGSEPVAGLAPEPQPEPAPAGPREKPHTGTVSVSPPATTRTAPDTAGTSSAVPTPSSAASGGRYVLQVASFKDAAQARTLSRRLAGKGYVTFVRDADLGPKGVWHRVFAGPYSDRATADKAAARLKKEEKFSPLVRRQ
ncbi:MAG: SPOR domain-containing protein [Deltaproteobacteria bacterium]|nr:MAG: SPOR domain-containing protein [Deltaproteobacteria bacterium]